MDKKILRNKVRQLKSLCTSTQLAQMSISAIQKLKLNTHFQTARTICLYNSLPDEVDTHTLIDELKLHKRILLPSIQDGEIVLHEYTLSDTLTEGDYGIQESQGRVFTDFDSIDLVIVPAVAFDANGRRLGRGGGYYDRFIKKLTHAVLVGVGYDFQLVDEVPAARHDQRVNRIILPSKTIQV